MPSTKFRTTALACAAAAVFSLGALSGAQAAEEDAKTLLKAMSDYMASQQTFSMTFDTSLEVVTKDKQKIMLATTGTMEASRPDKLHVTRTGGFADVEFIFDGKTLTVVGKNRNIYVQTDMPGTYYQLIEDLREKFHKPLAGADLLAENVNDHLMEGVTDVKDLGSGIIGGKECDHLAFRTAELDWQIWIAQGDQPYPCRYVITSTKADQAPQFMIDVREFKPGVASNFTFTPPEGAQKLDAGELKALRELSDLPDHFTIGE